MNTPYVAAVGALLMTFQACADAPETRNPALLHCEYVAATDPDEPDPHALPFESKSLGDCLEKTASLELGSDETESLVSKCWWKHPIVTFYGLPEGYEIPMPGPTSCWPGSPPNSDERGQDAT